jgi:hypothetical protein
MIQKHIVHSTFKDHLTENQYKKLSDIVAFIATCCSKQIPGFPEISHWKKGLDRKGILMAQSTSRLQMTGIVDGLDQCLLGKQ